MKTMTCNQLGGACDKSFHGKSFEEIAEQSYRLNTGGVTMNQFNIHSYNNMDIPFKVSKRMLEGINLKVPKLKEVVMEELNKTQIPQIQENTSVNRTEDERRQKIKDLASQLNSIKNDFNLNKKLLEIYYGEPEDNALRESRNNNSNSPLRSTRNTTRNS